LEFPSINLILSFALSQGILDTMGPIEKISRIPTANGVTTFSPARRRFLKRAIRLTALAPIWTIACDRAAREDRQGAIEMQTNENPVVAGTAAPTHPIPLIDTRIPPVIQTATFAMG
jgi:hypothetical protein